MKGVLTLTGQLGDVMKESAQAAVSGSAVTRRSSIDPGFWAGTTCTSTRRPAPFPDGPRLDHWRPPWSRCHRPPGAAPARHDRRDHLSGRVLPVGIKDKVLAAHRADHAVILPRQNEKALVEDVPAAGPA
jgi:ATP-dependent Lon protease